MTDAEFQSAVTADIKALVARCVCGAEDYPDVQRVSSYRQAYRITCDACGRVLYSPTQTEAILDWERMSAQDKTSAALLAGVNRVLALLDDEADVVDGEHGNQIPNTAMRIAQMIRDEMKGNA